MAETMASDREEEALSTMPPSTHVLVWDIPTRLFHWSIVALVLLSWVSADQGYMTLHLWSGMALLTLLLFRVAWGFFGSTTARFGNFLHTPPEVLRYLRRGGGKLLYAGHNPAGGLMVLAMIAVLLAQAATGLFASDGIRFHGPLALLVTEDQSLQITDLHGTIFNIILLLIWCHIAAIGFYLLVKGENLIRPMFTGRKASAKIPEGTDLRFTHGAAALLIVVAIAGLVAWAFLGRL